jgi:lipopolysaccharide export system protein LptA
VIALLAIAQLALAGLPGTTTAPATSRAGSRAQSATSAKTTPPTHVDANAIEYLYKERRTIMRGKPLVTFTREDAKLVCRKMVADHDPAGDIHRAVCEGDVKLTRGEKVVTCDRATYDAATSKVVCRGDPILHDGASIMYCEEVVYDLDLDRVFLKQGKGTLIQKPGQSLPGKKGAAQ